MYYKFGINVMVINLLICIDKIYNKTAIRKATGGAMKESFTVRWEGEMGRRDFVQREMKSIPSVSKRITETNNGVETPPNVLKIMVYDQKEETPINQF